MKNRQIRLTIGVLVGLVLFSSSLAFLFYAKQTDKSLQDDNTIEVFLAKQHIAKGEMIGLDDLEKSYLPKSYLSAAPLTEAEIIGRYAVVEMFDKELFRKEKISVLQPEQVQTPVKIEEVALEEETQAAQINDTLTLPLSLFQNIDTSLKVGDYIDIVSAIPKGAGAKNTEFDTKYIALHILISSFVSNSIQMQELVKQTDNKFVYADSVVVEMSPNEIRNFFATYYKTQELNTNRVFNTSKESKGHLWMIKCSSSEDERLQQTKDRLMVDHIAQKKRAKAVESVSISYEE